MQHVLEPRGASSVSEVAAILAAGFLRARLRAKGVAGINVGNTPLGLDVFEDVSVHRNRPNVKGEAR